MELGFLTKRALVILQKLSRAKDTERDYFVPPLRLSDLRKSVLLATFKNCAIGQPIFSEVLRQWPRHVKEVFENLLQNPERLRHLRSLEAKLTEEEVLPQPRRMRRRFSNTSETCLGH